ncbi:glycosyltransferase, partial [Escherichia coli]|nr:glycosyltransferase [Escherichia coli]
EGNSRIQCEGNIPLPKEFIVTVSTLTDRKRVDRTIKAMPKIIREYGEIDLLIIGEGQLRNDLQNLVKELNIEKYVHFLGFQTNPYYFINKAQLLILSSDSEGLPTVIIESLILGTPVLSTDCPTGPNEILVNWGDESLVSLTKTSDENNICNELAEKAIRLLCKKYDKKYVKHKSDLQRFDEKK